MGEDRGRRGQELLGHSGGCVQGLGGPVYLAWFPVVCGLLTAALDKAASVHLNPRGQGYVNVDTIEGGNRWMCRSARVDLRATRKS